MVELAPVVHADVKLVALLGPTLELAVTFVAVVKIAVACTRDVKVTFVKVSEGNVVADAPLVVFVHKGELVWPDDSEPIALDGPDLVC